MLTSVVGYPRVGGLRELKFATEKYFRGETDADALRETGVAIRASQWKTMREAGIDLIPSNDFSYYDTLLDTAQLLNIVPERYRNLGLSEFDTYFAMARGYQGDAGDVHALPMKKWFNTNYHYMVPEAEDTCEVRLVGTKPFDEYREALALGIRTKPVIVGPFTLIKLLVCPGKKEPVDFADAIAAAYAELMGRLSELGAAWVQFDEPYLVHDLTEDDEELLKRLYAPVLAAKGAAKLLVQTYFGDVRDVYGTLCGLGIDGIGLDFVEGSQTADLVRANPVPADVTLFAGLVCGKNIWKNNYAKTLEVLDGLRAAGCSVALGTSCSLLHVPYSLKNETALAPEYAEHFAFAEEKLGELAELAALAELAPADRAADVRLTSNARLFAAHRPDSYDAAVHARVAAIADDAYTRMPVRSERERIQKEELGLPLFPTTTIGSFPQTDDVRHMRRELRRGEATPEEYREFTRGKISDCVKLQEELGLDVLVHGEYERNDMVEYFGEQLNGFIFTKKAWVQSYGTRCVKPPIIWGDVSRDAPMTVEWSSYAQSLTDKPVKGMLTGPVTILNWSFPREDVSHEESVKQIALAIRDEVLDLERAGIKVIQIDEAALREKLPLRKSDWHSAYLDWAIPSFRLVHSGVAPTTQIHTHMCYSEFGDIIADIDAMDADVISFEASRSDLTILDDLERAHFQTEVGPGVYDIHSPRIPATDEIVEALERMLQKVDRNKLWVNPDCGLKTRGVTETVASLRNLVAAARTLRERHGASN